MMCSCNTNNVDSVVNDKIKGKFFGVRAVLITWYFSCLTAVSASASASTTTTPVSPRDVTKDYCMGEKFHAVCNHDEVISMKYAVYGRMSLGRCVQLNMGYLGCQDDVLDLADDKCSGRHSCEIPVPDPTFEKMKACLELQSYLNASYTCIKVLTIDTLDCSKPMKARLPSGSIASVMSNESRCLSRFDTTWLITGLPGQRVNISLLDFKATTAARHSKRPGTDDTVAQQQQQQAPPQQFPVTAGDVSNCHKYATIVELSTVDDEMSTVAATESLNRAGEHQHPFDQQQSYRVLGPQHPDHTQRQLTSIRRTFNVCGRQTRRRHIYTSASHMVEIQLEWRRASPDYFVLSYEVYGCPNPPLAPNMWFQRTSDSEATVGCRTSNDKWRLTCGPGPNYEWTGEIGNCTQFEAIELAVKSSSVESTNNAGVLTVLLCTCAFIIALIVIVTGVILHRRRRRRGAGRSSSSAKSGSAGGGYDITHRGHMTPKSDYGGVPEDYDDDMQCVGGGDLSYVYPSRTRGGGGGGGGGGGTGGRTSSNLDEECGPSGSSRHHHRSSGPPGSEFGGSGAYDIVDGGKSIRSTSDGPYEKVTSYRYVHIWEMPLPKAPDE